MQDSWNPDFAESLKIAHFLSPNGLSQAQNATKHVVSWGFIQDSTGGADDAALEPLVGWEGERPCIPTSPSSLSPNSLFQAQNVPEHDQPWFHSGPIQGEFTKLTRPPSWLGRESSLPSPLVSSNSVPWAPRTLGAPPFSCLEWKSCELFEVVVWYADCVNCRTSRNKKTSVLRSRWRVIGLRSARWPRTVRNFRRTSDVLRLRSLSSKRWFVPTVSNTYVHHVPKKGSHQTFANNFFES